MLKSSTVLINALLISLLAFPAVAADTKVHVGKSKSLRSAKPPPAVDEGIKFGLSFNERISIQAERQDDGSRGQYLTHELVPSLTTTNYNFLADFIFYDQYNKPATSEWDMTALIAGLNKPLDVSTYFTLAPTAMVILPLFLSHAVDFQGAAGGQITASLKGKELSMPNFIFKYGWRLLKFAQRNEYQVDGSGNAVLDKAGDKQYNTNWLFRQRFHLGYKFTDKLTFMFFAQFDSKLLFNSEYGNGFAHETTLEYAVNDVFSLNIGTTNAGGIYAGDYQEIDNLKFYNKESSEHFVGFGLSF